MDGVDVDIQVSAAAVLAEIAVNSVNLQTEQSLIDDSPFPDWMQRKKDGCRLSIEWFVVEQQLRSKIFSFDFGF